jgi:hypothetical protein
MMSSIPSSFGSAMLNPFVKRYWFDGPKSGLVQPDGMISSGRSVVIRASADPDRRDSAAGSVFPTLSTAASLDWTAPSSPEPKLAVNIEDACGTP